MHKLIIDSGGTSFKYMVLDKKYKTIEKKEIKCGSVLTDFKNIILNIKKIFIKYPNITSGIFGFAGYEALNKTQIDKLKQSFKKIKNYLLINDGELSTFYTSDDFAIAINLGTGMVINKRDKNILKQYLGLGFAIGDVGSGYAIGQKILFGALAYEKNDYLREIKKILKLKNTDNIIEYIYSDMNLVSRKISRVAKSLTSKNESFKRFSFKKYRESLEELILILKKIVKPKYTLILNGSICSKIKQTKTIIKKAFPKNKILLIEENALQVGKKILRDKAW